MRDGKKKQYWKWVGMLVLLFLLLGGCAREEETEEQAQEEQVTFDWYINYSWYNTGFGENLVSQKITEDTGVFINFIAPSGNEAERLDSLISSDSLPDIITLGWWEDQVDTMIEKDMVYALNELADEYDPYFWKVTDDAVIEWYTRSDGNVYCYPNSSFTPEDYETHEDIAANQTFLVRKDIYEAIGSPDMTTPEGFQEAVKKAAEMFSGSGWLSIDTRRKSCFLIIQAAFLLTNICRTFWQFPLKRMENITTAIRIRNISDGLRPFER